MQRNDDIEKCGTNDLLRSSTEDQQEAPLVGNRPTFTSVFDRHTCYPFFIKLCKHLAIAEIVALTRTCKKYADLYQYLRPIQWDVDRRLRRFVRNLHGFRSQMAKCDALIVGSFVSQFFERTPRETSGLNIFVKGLENASSFQSYLLDEEGYTGIPSIREPIEVLKLLKISNHAQIERGEEACTTGPSVTKVRLFLNYRTPINTILENFDSTIIVNFMSWNKAYSVFPLSTFVQYRGYQLGANGSFPALLQERLAYPLGRWNMQEIMCLGERRLNHPIRTFRRVGDRFTWTIPFDTENVQWSKIPDYVLEYASFQLESRYLFKHCDYKIFTYIYTNRTLKYQYLVNLDMAHWVREKIYRSTVVEPREIDQSAKPVVSAGITDYRERPVPRLMEPWGGLISLDAEFPEWYSEWERLIGDDNTFPEFPEFVEGGLLVASS